MCGIISDDPSLFVNVPSVYFSNVYLEVMPNNQVCKSCCMAWLNFSHMKGWPWNGGKLQVSFNDFHTVENLQFFVSTRGKPALGCYKSPSCCRCSGSLYEFIRYAFTTKVGLHLIILISRVLSSNTLSPPSGPPS